MTDNNTTTSQEPDRVVAYECHRCKGREVLQQVSLMADPFDQGYEVHLGDADWDDFFYCVDCADECKPREVMQSEEVIA